MPRKGFTTVEEYLFREGPAFNFFQAVRLLEQLDGQRRPLGRGGPPGSEVVRLRAHLSLAFPPSMIYELERPTPVLPVPALTVSFLGLTGPSGVLPRHYTELLLRLERDGKGAEKRALREWFDLFNHRLLSLFYRAWEKYRFWVPYERGAYTQRDLDPFTQCLFSLVGLGEPRLRNRLRVSCWVPSADGPQEKVLGRIDDLGLLRFGGFLAHRPRNAVSLEAMLRTYLKLPVKIQQFQGQWLQLGAGNLSSLKKGGVNATMGRDVVVGDRVWDVQGKIRVRLGPLQYSRFQEFLPDRTAVEQRKAIFLLAHMVRLYAGAEVDVDVQLVLKKEEVPGCQLGQRTGLGSRLGWNTWAKAKPMPRDAEEAVFLAEEKVWMRSGPS
jgi:type VI secretion system protein ImpH